MSLLFIEFGDWVAGVPIEQDITHFAHTCLIDDFQRYIHIIFTAFLPFTLCFVGCRVWLFSGVAVLNG